MEKKGTQCDGEEGARIWDISCAIDKSPQLHATGVVEIASPSAALDMLGGCTTPCAACFGDSH